MQQVALILISFISGLVILLTANAAFFFRFFFAKSRDQYKPSHVIYRFYTGALFKWILLILGCLLAFSLGLVLWAMVLGFLFFLMGFYLFLGHRL